jgi:hypothetical protein
MERTPIRHSLLTNRFLQHSPTNQRFHVLDVVAADLVGDRADAACARHCLATEKQMIAGADQAGVKEDRIDLAELAGSDALGEQPALEIEQGRDKELRDLARDLRAGLMPQLVDKPVHVGKAAIGADDAGDMQLQFLGRRDRLRQKIFEVCDFARRVTREQGQQQPVLVAKMVFHQRRVDA